uniref:Uncharacterized protein n=1 Tax=Schistosoma japonicum TaxID=6182 RepID=Q5BWB9_SCHJA|nr:unknown [Schistosoma japonicum]
MNHNTYKILFIDSFYQSMSQYKLLTIAAVILISYILGTK